MHDHMEPCYSQTSIDANCRRNVVEVVHIVPVLEAVTVTFQPITAQPLSVQIVNRLYTHGISIHTCI